MLLTGTMSNEDKFLMEAILKFTIIKKMDISDKDSVTQVVDEDWEKNCYCNPISMYTHRNSKMLKNIYQCDKSEYRKKIMKKTVCFTCSKI